MQPLIIAHRGAPAHVPEHTETSYRLAIRQGADLVEPDLVPTRDGVLLVRHEPGLASTTDVATHPEVAGRRRAELGDDVEWFAEDFDWAELQQLRAVERIPQLRPESAELSGREPLLRLRELVLIVNDEARARGRHCGLVLELKNDARMRSLGFDFVQLLAQELDGLWHLDALRGVYIESFEVPVLDRLRAAALPWVDAPKLVVLVTAGHERQGIEEGPARLTRVGLDDAARFAGISVRTSLLGVDGDERSGLDAPLRGQLFGRELVAAAHERGLEVLTYTLRSEDAFLPSAFHGRPDDYSRALAATGIDGVFADSPAAARASLRAIQESGGFFPPSRTFIGTNSPLS